MKKIFMLLLVCVLFSSCGNVEEEVQSNRRANREEKSEKEVKKEDKKSDKKEDKIQENDNDVENVEDRIDKEENVVTKEDSIEVSIKYEYVDFGNEKIFETALNDGVDVTEKIVIFTADEIHPESAWGFNLWSGEHLNFITEEDDSISDGDILIGKVIECQNFAGSWIISIDILDEAVVNNETIWNENNLNNKKEKSKEENIKEETDDELNEVNEKETGDIDSDKQEEVDVKVVPVNGSSNYVAVFIKNNSSKNIGDLELQVCFYDMSGNAIDVAKDGHDAILPGYTVVSYLDAPDTYDSYEATYKISGGYNYTNYSNDVYVSASIAGSSPVVQIVNNSNVTIEEIEYIVLLYNGNDLVAGTYADDVYDVAPGEKVTEEAVIKGYNSVKYDRAEVYLNQAHTF